MGQLTEKQKIEITKELNLFLSKKTCTQQKIADDCGFNESYVSHIKNGKYQLAESLISDLHFSLIAKRIGLKLKINYWDRCLTKETRKIEEVLYDAKEDVAIKTIIADTGRGKTYTVNHFMDENRDNYVYRITVGQLHRVNDVIDDILIEMGIKPKGAPLSRFRRITKNVEKLYHQGKEPLIIIDEAENLKLPVLGFTKQLYDAIVETKICGIVLIGTDQLLDSIKKMMDSKKLGIPQFSRRIQAGTILVNDLKEEWYKDEAFRNYVMSIVKDERIFELLKGQASNYGEVHDFIVTALKDATKAGVEFNYRFYIKKYKLGNDGDR